VSEERLKFCAPPIITATPEQGREWTCREISSFGSFGLRSPRPVGLGPRFLQLGPHETRMTAIDPVAGDAGRESDADSHAPHAMCGIVLPEDVRVKKNAKNPGIWILGCRAPPRRRHASSQHTRCHGRIAELQALSRSLLHPATHHPTTCCRLSALHGIF
jgi:hypothetical protein